jgi:hypothetical protein
MEEGFMLVFPERVLHGAIPNVDFLHLYGPGSLWALAAAFKVFGTSLWTERLFGYGQLLLLVAGVYALLLAFGEGPFGRRVAAGGASVAAIIVIPPIGLTALAWVGGVALGLWAMVAALAARREADDRRAGRLFVAAGLLAGAALLFRLDLIVAVTLGLAVAAAGVAAVRRRRLLIGLAAGLSPYLVHVAMAGPGHVITGMIIDPVFNLRGGRRLPLPPSWDHFDGFLQRAGLLNAPSWPFPAPPSPAQLSLWLGLLLLVVALLVATGWTAVRADRDGVMSRALLVMGVFSLGMLPQALQRADSTHLAWVSCVPLGFLPAAVWELARRWRPQWRGLLREWVPVAAPFVLLLALVPHFTLRTYADATAQSLGYHRESYTIRHGDRVFYYGRKDAADAVNAMLTDIDRLTKPGQRLFVGTGDLRKTPYSEAFLYYLLPDLVPSTYFIEMDPGMANKGDRLANDLAGSDVAILSSIRDDWDEPNDARVVGSDAANQVLHRDFCLAGSYGQGLFGHGLYELYLRCTP